MEGNGTVDTPTTTPWEIREAIRAEIGWFVDDQGLDGSPAETDALDVELYGRCAAVLRDLCASLESIDRVCAASTPVSNVTPPVNVEALAVRLWNATQEAGASTEVGDAVVAELKEAMSG